MTTLFCFETPGLKLGPGTQSYHEESAADSYIQFVDGYATIPEVTPLVLAWINHAGTPHIEIIEDEEGRVPDSAPGAETCPVCGKSFATKRKLGGHLMSHKK